MGEFYKYNKILVIGILIMILSIPIGFIFNSGGIILMSILLILITLKDFIFKIIGYRRYKSWATQHDSRCFLNINTNSLEIVSRTDFEELESKFILSVYDNNRIYSLSNTNNIRNLCKYNELYLDESFALLFENGGIIKIELRLLLMIF